MRREKPRPGEPLHTYQSRLRQIEKKSREALLAERIAHAKRKMALFEQATAERNEALEAYRAATGQLDSTVVPPRFA